MSSAKKQKRQKKKDKKRNSLEQQIKSSRLASVYHGAVQVVHSTASSVYTGTERAINTCIVNPIYWTANSVFHVTTAPIRLGFFMFDYMTCRFDELPVIEDPQVEETTKQLIKKLEQRIWYLERDVKRLNRKKSLSPSSPFDLPAIELSSPSVPPPPPFAAVPPPPPPPPMVAPPPPFKLTITKKTHSESTIEKKPKQASMPAVSLQDISNVKLKRVSLLDNNKTDGSRPEIPTLRRPLVSSHRQPPSPKGLATVTMRLRKVEKSPGGTPLKPLARIVTHKHSPKRHVTSPTLKNIKRPVNDENTPINTNIPTLQLTSPVKQQQQPQLNDVTSMVTSA